MDSRAEVAQLGDRRARLGARALEDLRDFVARRAERVTGQTQPEQDPHEALLGAVVEVAHEAATLGVGGGDDPRPGGMDLLGPGPLDGLAASGLLVLHLTRDVAEDDDRAPATAGRQRGRGVGDAELRAVLAPERVAVVRGPSRRSSAAAASGTRPGGTGSRPSGDDGSSGG